jgi:hypothetical protein
MTVYISIPPLYVVYVFCYDIILCEDEEKSKILQLLINQFKRSFMNFDGVGVGGCQLDYDYDRNGREKNNAC